MLRLRERFEHVHAADAGHLEVREDDVVVLLLGELEARLAGVGGVDLDVVLLEDALAALDDNVLVVDDEHAGFLFHGYRFLVLRVRRRRYARPRRMILCARSISPAAA